MQIIMDNVVIDGGHTLCFNNDIRFSHTARVVHTSTELMGGGTLDQLQLDNGVYLTIDSDSIVFHPSKHHCDVSYALGADDRFSLSLHDNPTQTAFNDLMAQALAEQ